jgi:hypothetical protein
MVQFRPLEFAQSKMTMAEVTVVTFLGFFFLPKEITVANVIQFLISTAFMYFLQGPISCLTRIQSFLVMQWLSSLPSDLRVAGSNPAKRDGFLRAKKSVARLISKGKQIIRPYVRCYGMLKISWGMINTDRKKISSHFSPTFPCFAVRCPAATRAVNSFGWMGNNYNWVGEHSRAENGRTCTGRFVRYHPVTVASNQ